VLSNRLPPLTQRGKNMAERRMFSKKIIDSDVFVDMPLSAQALYLHIGMNADDDGMVGNPKKVQRSIGASDDDLKLLIAKEFVIAFPSGVIAVKHWKVNNQIRKDRHQETIYLDEKATLLEDESNVYQLGKPNGNQMATKWQPSIDKYSIDKVSIVKDSIVEMSRDDNSQQDNSVNINNIINDEKNNFPSNWQDMKYEEREEWIASH